MPLNVFEFAAIIAVAAILCVPLDASPVVNQPEMRGVWIASWPWAVGMQTPDEVDRSIELARQANINALFVEVRKAADAHYKSSIEPPAEELASAPSGWDPLQYIIDRAHASGIEVHAWMVTFRVWKGKKAPVDPRHLKLAHPEWLNRRKSGAVYHEEGYYLDPAIPEVRDHTVKVYLDVVKNYDVDGVHFDYVRYPGPDWGYSPRGLKEFYKWKGNRKRPDPEDAGFCTFRRDCVTDVVRRVYRGVKAIKPEVKVTAAVVAWGNPPLDFTKTIAYTKVYQDWRSWAREGIVDAIIPMNYSKESDEGGPARWRAWCDRMRDWRFNRHAYTGYWFDQPSCDVVSQIEEARKRGLDGQVGFAFHAGETRDRVAQSLAEGPYAEKCPVPSMPWIASASGAAGAGLYKKAMQELADGRYDAGVDLLEQSVSAEPGNSSYRLQLALALLCAEKKEEAAAVLEEGCRLFPEDKRIQDAWMRYRE